jgi:glycosyltransferase involved in cell wall biosynthesis
MTAPLVSILIPCYRQGHFLADAIRSALGQVGVSVEVIVINDGSDDDTETVAMRFGDRIRYYRQPNQGLPAARNRGLAMARGRYVLCLDADDMLDPRAAGWLVAAAAGREDVLCVMGHAHFDEHRPVGAPGRPTWLPPREPLEARLLTANFGPPHGYLCSRAMLLAGGGFDPTLRSCEDWDAWVNLVFAGATVVPVHEIGALYRQHPDSMSRNPVEMSRARAEVLRRTLRRLRRSGVGGSGRPARSLRAALRGRLAAESVDEAYWLRERGEYGAALVCYLRGLRGGEATALVGACKLGPHGLRRVWRRWGARADMATTP